MRKLKKDFIGKKRFCSTPCALAFRRYSGVKNKNKVKKEKQLVKKSEPRSKWETQQISSKIVSDSKTEAKQVEAPAE